MRHLRVVKSIEIGSKLYTTPKHAAKRWLEEAAFHVRLRSKGASSDRVRRAWEWTVRYWVTARPTNRTPVYKKRLARVERIMEGLLK